MAEEVKESETTNSLDTETEQAKSNNKKSPLFVRIILWVLFGIYMALVLTGIIYSIACKRSKDGTLTIANHQLRIVTSESMAENKIFTDEEYKTFEIGSIPKYSLVSIEKIPESGDKKYEFYDNVKRGDVLTFYYKMDDGRQEIVTHRVLSKTENKLKSQGHTTYVITLEGDNVESGKHQILDTARDETSTNFVIGKVVYKSKFFGVILFALSSRWMLIFGVVIPCAGLFGYEIFRIIRMVVKEKKEEKVAAIDTPVIADEKEKTIQEKDQEIEELRKRLAMLEQEKNENSQK